jgi:hypothetical protein
MGWRRGGGTGWGRKPRRRKNERGSLGEISEDEEGKSRKGERGKEKQQERGQRERAERENEGKKSSKRGGKGKVLKTDEEMGRMEPKQEQASDKGEATENLGQLK